MGLGSIGSVRDAFTPASIPGFSASTSYTEEKEKGTLLNQALAASGQDSLKSLTKTFANQADPNNLDKPVPVQQMTADAASGLQQVRKEMDRAQTVSASMKEMAFNEYQARGEKAPGLAQSSDLMNGGGMMLGAIGIMSGNPIPIVMAAAAELVETGGYITYSRTSPSAGSKEKGSRSAEQSAWEQQGNRPVEGTLDAARMKAEAPAGLNAGAKKGPGREELDFVKQNLEGVWTLKLENDPTYARLLKQEARLEEVQSSLQRRKVVGVNLTEDTAPVMVANGFNGQMNAQGGPKASVQGLTI